MGNFNLTVCLVACVVLLAWSGITVQATPEEPVYMEDVCVDWRVVEDGLGSRMLYAYCPVTGLPPTSKPMFAFSRLNLHECLANEGGVVEFQTNGSGTQTCDAFLDTRGTTIWTTRCAATDAEAGNETSTDSCTTELDISCRFTWADNSLSCFRGQDAHNAAPLDWACRNLSLSRDAPGVLAADCPADMTLDRYVRSFINLNRCIGLNATEPGWPVPEEDGNALEHCKNCALSWTNSTIGPASRAQVAVTNAVLVCTCRTPDAAAFLDRPTVFIPLNEHVGWSPHTLRPVCLGGQVQGSRVMHDDPLQKPNV